MDKISQAVIRFQKLYPHVPTYLRLNSDAELQTVMQAPTYFDSIEHVRIWDDVDGLKIRGALGGLLIILNYDLPSAVGNEEAWENL